MVEMKSIDNSDKKDPDTIVVNVITEKSKGASSNADSNVKEEQVWLLQDYS